MRILACLLAAILAVPAVAQDTRASAAAKFDAEFTASDTNKDGALTRAEVQARIGRMAAGPKKIDPVRAKRLTDLWFTNADANKDGKVTKGEAQALLSKTFDRYEATQKAGAAGPAAPGGR